MAKKTLNPGDVSLDRLEADIWALLTRGKADRRHGFHFPVVATSSPSGLVDARTVVLRQVDRERRVLAFHTDARSPKLQGLTAGAPVAWVFYDPRRRQQVRARGSVGACSPAAIAEAWARTSLSSRRNYLVPAAPGTPIASPEDGWVHAHLTAAEGETGRAAFTVVETIIEHIDWLSLHAGGHLRASLVWNDTRRAFDQSWIMP